MVSRFEGTDKDTTPQGAQAATTPEDFMTRRDIDTQNSITLQEIHFEQGRQAERAAALQNAVTTLTLKVDALATSMSHVDRSIREFAPKIEEIDDTYKRARGAFWAFSISLGVLSLIVASAGTLLYWSNSARLDKLNKILESSEINKLLKKDSK